jgi:hypothetical protein
VGFHGVFEFIFVEVEDEDFVAFLQEVAGEAAANSLGGWKVDSWLGKGREGCGGLLLTSRNEDILLGWGDGCWGCFGDAGHICDDCSWS